MADPVNSETPTAGGPTPETAPTPSAEATKTPEELAREANLNDISDLLGMDQEEERSGVKDPPKPEGETESVVGKEEQKGAPAPKPDNEVVKPEGKGEELKDLLKQVLAENKPAEKEPAKPTPEEEKPRYNPQIPDALFQALDHEDPAIRRQGMNAMIGGAMNKVYSDVMKEVKAQLPVILQQVPQMIQQTEQARQQQKEMHDAFYADNPNFGSSPKRKQLVATVAIQMAQTLGKDYKGFTPEFRTALAQQIEEMTGIKAGKVSQPATGTTKAPVEKVPFQANGSPARAPNAGTPSLQDEIADTISFN